MSSSAPIWAFFATNACSKLAAVDAEHDSAEHLQEAAVGILGEPLVAGQRGQAGDGFVVEAEVQDGVHHARHGEFGARAHADEQRVRGVAERFAGLDLERGDGARGRPPQSAGQLFAVAKIVVAGVRRDREAGRARAGRPWSSPRGPLLCRRGGRASTHRPRRGRHPRRRYIAYRRGAPSLSIARYSATMGFDLSACERRARGRIGARIVPEKWAVVSGLRAGARRQIRRNRRGIFAVGRERAHRRAFRPRRIRRWHARPVGGRRSRPPCRASSARAATPSVTSSVPKPPGDAPMTATGRLPNTRGISAVGRDNQSIAFLNTPGIPLLYSGVTSNRPSAATTRSLSFANGIGQTLRSFDVAVVERNALDAAGLERHARRHLADRGAQQRAIQRSGAQTAGDTENRRHDTHLASCSSLISSLRRECAVAVTDSARTRRRPRAARSRRWT